MYKNHNMATINISLVKPNAIVPTKGSLHSAGYDLYSTDAMIVSPHGRACIGIGIVVEIPEGYYGQIMPRSGLAVKYGIDTGAGVIDSDYRGEIRVIMFNNGDHPFEVSVGARIAQLIIIKIHESSNMVVNHVATLTKTARSDSGFGSTGI